MVIYLDLVMLVSFLVNLLLVVAANRMCAYPVKLGRAAIAAAIGAIYAGFCLLPGFRFLGNAFWRMVALGVMSLIAFGWNFSAARRSAVFVFLSMAVGGIALGIGKDGVIALLAAAGGMCVLCGVGIRGSVKEYVTVQLAHRGMTQNIIALRDTGNTLTDPVTGQSVLVVDADVAGKMLGLSQEELLCPIETMAKGRIAGLRLIPYRSVGNANGMMLAAKMDQVLIGGRQSGSLVAFAPQRLGAGEFQALAGGCL